MIFCFDIANMFVCKSQEIVRKGEMYMFLKSLLGASIATDWQDKVINAVTNLLVPILVIGCSVGMIWAVVVGIKMMKADDKNARDEAKAKLVNIAISIVAIAVLIGLFYALSTWLQGTGDKKVSENTFGDLFNKDGGGNGGQNSVNPLMNTFNLVKQCASMIIFKC